MLKCFFLRFKGEEQFARHNNLSLPRKYNSICRFIAIHLTGSKNFNSVLLVSLTNENFVEVQFPIPETARRLVRVKGLWDCLGRQMEIVLTNKCIFWQIVV